MGFLKSYNLSVTWDVDTMKRVAFFLLNALRSRIRRSPVRYAFIASGIVLSTVLIKDNIAEDIRSHISSTELAEQFYKLHSENLFFASWLKEISNSVDALSTAKSGSEPTVLDKTIKGAIENSRDARTNALLTKAANQNAEELLNQVSDSELFFTYSDGESRILRGNLKISNNALKALNAQLKQTEEQWNEASRNISSDESANLRVFSKLKNDIDHEAIQAENLKDLSDESRQRASKTADLYRQYLETENTICRRVLIALVVIGAALGFISGASRAEAA